MMREPREQGRFGRKEERPEPRPVQFESPDGGGPRERTIEPLPGESFAHLSDLRQLPSSVEGERTQPESLAVWNPMFQESAGQPAGEMTQLGEPAQTGSGEPPALTTAAEPSRASDR